ncbi:hypothetical protein EDC65_3371 [Stella humosa]|uniref:DUF2000 family protein n=1 Tax=Stella humosa TaxID=94 RepID=A0A3N1L0Q0_9PROT|nr:DUF2000 family protein [Stella humosa]ROP84026.1 hypothetical protein EDC65_3371 [Stella humosa]BBK33535.1 hypothetical protein STHU_41690 [Stella humosa]
MRYETRIAVVIRDELETWQKLNVASFLSGGLVGQHPELPGEPYLDATGQRYGPLVRRPILVFVATGSELARCLRRSLDRGLLPSIYTRDLFSTSHDAANRAAVAAVVTADLDLVGLAIHGDRKVVDKAIDGLKLHP